MKLLHAILLKLYALWVAIVFTVFMLLFLPGLTIPFLFGTRLSFIGYFFLLLWSWIFSILTRIRYTRDGIKNMVKGKSYIYVCNHTSFLDLPGLCILISGEYRPLAKKELLKLPIFGLIAKGASVIVDRSKGSGKSISQLIHVLNKGISILIFPEGTQNRTNQILQPFKDGAFRIAIETQKEILPITIEGAGKLLPPGTLQLKPGVINLKAGKPIPTEGLTSKDIESLKKKTYNIMHGMLADKAPE